MQARSHCSPESRSRFNPYRRFGAPEKGWRKFFPGGFTFDLVEADYARFFIGPAMAVLAPRLQAALARAAEPDVSATDKRIDPLPAAAYAAEIRVPTTLEVEAGRALTMSVTIRNASPVVWERADLSGIGVGNHWLSKTGEMRIWADGQRGLSDALAPGAHITLPLTIRAPAVPGEYVLEIDMVEEGVTWFKDKGALCAFVSVVVTRRRSRTQMKELEELRVQLDTVREESRVADRRANPALVR